MMFKKWQDAFISNLSNFDMFEEPVKLNVRGKTTLTSSLGGLISLLIIAFLGSQAIIQSINMFNRASPQVIQTNEFQRNPENVYMDRQNNFLFAVVTRLGPELVNISEASRLSFTATYQQQRFGDDGSLVLFPSTIHWAPCNRSNFPTNVFSADTYDTFGLFFAYCPIGLNFTNSTGSCPEHIKQDYPDCFTPPDFILQGTIFSSSFKYINFNVKVCDSADSVSIYGLQCSSNPKDEIAAASGIEFYLAFSNNYLNPGNYDRPYQTFLDYFKWNIHPNLSSTADVYVDMETIKDYDSYLFADIENSLSFYHIATDKMREQQVFPRDTLLEMVIQRSNLNHITTRNYVKILDVVANVGGLSELFLFLGAIITLGYARYKYFMIVSNELYDFEPIEQQKTVVKKILPLSTDDNVLEKTERKDTAFIEMSPAIKTQEKEERGSKESIVLQKKKRGMLEFNEFRYFKGLVWKVLRKKDPGEELAAKGRERVMKDLDIVNIIEKVKEIDKLKKLIMNQNQLEAFNYIEKPLIGLAKEESANKKSSKRDLSLNTTSIEAESSKHPLFEFKETNDSQPESKRLYVAYKYLKEDKDLRNLVYNRKIIGMMGEDVIKMFNQLEKQEKVVTSTKKTNKSSREMQDELIDVSKLRR